MLTEKVETKKKQAQEALTELPLIARPLAAPISEALNELFDLLGDFAYAIEAQKQMLESVNQELDSIKKRVRT